MKASEFLRYCARLIDAGEEITQGDAELIGPSKRATAAHYLILTCAVRGDSDRPAGRARILRFLLAAEMARSDGL